MADAYESDAKDQGNFDEIEAPDQKAFRQVDAHYLQQCRTRSALLTLTENGQDF